MGSDRLDRGDEYRSGAQSLEAAEEWEEKIKAIRLELERIIQAKANKHYQPKPTLVVYLNLGASETRQNEVETAFDEVRQKHSTSFEPIHILWQGRLLS